MKYFTKNFRVLIKSWFQNNYSSECIAFSYTPRRKLAVGLSSAIFHGLRHGKGSSDCAYSHRRPRRSFRRKKPFLNGRKGGINTFFRREIFFLFSCWSCSRRLRGEIGRAEDPFLPNSGRKKLAEAGPPGKRPEEAKAGNCIGMYKKHFINSLKFPVNEVFYGEFVYAWNWESSCRASCTKNVQGSFTIFYF
jgi:hypothetical protein